MKPDEAHQTIADAVADLIQGKPPKIGLFTIPKIKSALSGEKPAATVAAVVKRLAGHPVVGPVLADAVRRAGVG